MTRAAIVFIAALFACLGGVIGTIAALDMRAVILNGVEDPFTDEALPFRPPLIGINVDLRQYADAETLASQLARMRAMGVHLLRQPVAWRDIAVSADRPDDFSVYDRLIPAAHAAGFDIVVVLQGTPDWAQAGDARIPDTAPPDDAALFGAFAGRFAARYADEVRWYEIWDEPNIEIGWGGFAPQPSAYLALLAAAYQSIHASDPDAQIIAASLAPTTEQRGRNISDWRFLQALYALDGAQWFDAASAKPYGFSLPDTDRTVREDVLNFSRMVGLRGIMRQNSDGHKPLWAGNFGWNALPDDWRGEASIWGAVTQQQQIDYTISALQRAASEWAWSGGLILHQWQPDRPCDDPQWGFALIGCDDSPTPLYHALQRAIPDLPTPVGVYSPANAYTAWSGVWTFGALGADIGWIGDSRARFTFNGTSAGLRLREDDYVAFLDVTIDGQPANALPIDKTGRSYINLTSDSGSAELNTVVTARGLSPGEHSMMLVADRGWDRWAIAGFVIGVDDSLTRAQDRQWMVSVVTALVGAAAAIITVARSRIIQAAWRWLAGLKFPGTAFHLLLSGLATIGLMVGLLLTVTDGALNIFRRESVHLLAALLSAGILFLQPHSVLVIASGVFLLALLLMYPRHGLLLTLFFAPFFLFPVELYRFAFPMAELLLLMTVSAAALRGLASWSAGWRNGEDRARLTALVRLNALDICVLLWVASGAAATVWSALTQRAITDLRVFYLEPALFYLLLRVYARDARFLRQMIDALLLSAAFVCAIGLFLFLTGQGVITAEEGARRLVSVYGSPNNVALFLGRGLPFLLIFTLMPFSVIRRLAAGALLIVSLITVGLTQSAGALFLGIPASLAAVLLLLYGRRGLIAIGIVGLGGLAALPILAQSARFSRLLDFSEGTNFFRLRVWESALNMLRDRPVTGFGLDQFLYAYRGRYLRPDAWQEPDLSHPHNFLLDIWLRMGVAGVLVFVLTQVIFWRDAFMQLKRFRGDNLLLTALLIGAMGSMISLLAHGLVDNSIFVTDLVYVWFLLIGIISNIKSIDADPQTVV